MTTATESILAKVRKLMNTASDSGATPSEADTALRIAARLMLEYRITDAQLREHARGEALKAGDVRAEDMTTERLGSYGIRGDGHLAMAVASVCGVRAYHTWAYPATPGARARKALMGAGLPADLAVAREMFTFLAAKMREELKAFAAARGIRASSVAARSFADGFACTLQSRADEEKARRMRSTDRVEIPASTGSCSPETTALVLVVGEAEQKLERALAVKARQLGLGKGRARRVRRDYGAYAAGGSAARKVSLSKDVLR